MNSRMERYEFDEKLGWKTRKDFEYLRSDKNFSHWLRYDSFGFPAPTDRQRDLTKTAPSLVLIGDSFIEGYYLPYPKTIAANIESALDFQILNSGVSGYSPAQYLLRFEELNSEFNISLGIVFLFPRNDLMYLESNYYQGYSKPVIDPATLEATNLPLKLIVKNDSAIDSILNLVRNDSAVYAILRPYIRRHLFYSKENDYDYANPYTLDKDELNIALKIISKIKNTLEDDTFAIVYIPDKSEISNSLTAHNKHIFLSTCEENKILCFHPDFAFNSSPEELYIEGDGHFNAVGARKMSDFVLRTVIPRLTKKPSINTH